MKTISTCKISFSVLSFLAFQSLYSQGPSKPEIITIEYTCGRYQPKTIISGVSVLPDSIRFSWARDPNHQDKIGDVKVWLSNQSETGIDPESDPEKFHFKKSPESRDAFVLKTNFLKNKSTKTYLHFLYKLQDASKPNEDVNPIFDPNSSLSESTADFPSQKLLFETNGKRSDDTSESTFIKITERDYLVAILTGVDETEYDQFVMGLSLRTPLGEIIRIIGDLGKEEVKTVTPSAGVVLVEKRFDVGELEGGFKYKYVIKKKAGNDEKVVKEFVVEVQEIVHVQLRVGPVFSWVEDPSHKLKAVKNDGSVSTDSARIVAEEGNGKGVIIAGGAFYPWGYNPRKWNPLENINFVIAIPFNTTIGESIFTGLGWGGTGLNIVAGVNWKKVEVLVPGFKNGDIVPSATDINNLKFSEWKICVFLGAWFDVKIFTRVFGTPN